jgi:hypothetical protein
LNISLTLIFIINEFSTSPGTSEGFELDAIQMMNLMLMVTLVLSALAAVLLIIGKNKRTQEE